MGSIRQTEYDRKQILVLWVSQSKLLLRFHKIVFVI